MHGSWTPIHPEPDTRTPGLGHPHTWNRTPAHPDLDTRTPGIGHPHIRTFGHPYIWNRTPEHQNSWTPIHPEPDRCTSGFGHPHTRNRTLANPDLIAGVRERRVHPCQY
jgi:hypothetical protein